MDMKLAPGTALVNSHRCIAGDKGKKRPEISSAFGFWKRREEQPASANNLSNMPHSGSKNHKVGMAFASKELQSRTPASDKRTQPGNSAQNHTLPQIGEGNPQAAVRGEENNEAEKGKPGLWPVASLSELPLVSADSDAEKTGLQSSGAAKGDMQHGNECALKAAQSQNQRHGEINSDGGPAEMSGKPQKGSLGALHGQSILSEGPDGNQTVKAPSQLAGKGFWQKHLEGAVQKPQSPPKGTAK